MIAVTLAILLTPLFLLLGWMTIESMAERARKRRAARPVPLTGEPPHVPAHAASSSAE